MTEIWKPVIIDGIETRYQISNFGNVAGIRVDRICPVVDKDGYLMFSLHFGDGSRTTAKIHRLVAQAFIPNPLNKPEVNHIDGNKQNNRVDNLEWVSGSENITHAFRIGLRQAPAEGENHQWCKYSSATIHEVCRLLVKGTSLQDIASTTGMSASEISNIRHGKTWKSISSKYEIPVGIDYKGKPLTVFTKEQRRDIRTLTILGFRSSEIVKGLNLPYSKQWLARVSDVQRQHRKRLKDESPTTIPWTTE